MKTFAQFIAEASKPSPGITHTIHDIGKHLEQNGWTKKPHKTGMLPGYSKGKQHIYLRDRSNKHGGPEADGVHHIAHLGDFGNGPAVKIKGIHDLHKVLDHSYFYR